MRLHRQRPNLTFDMARKSSRLNSLGSPCDMRIRNWCTYYVCQIQTCVLRLAVFQYQIRRFDPHLFISQFVRLVPLFWFALAIMQFYVSCG